MLHRTVVGQSRVSTAKNLIDETGNCYGRLTVLGRAENKYQRGRNAAHWWCQCECGSEFTVAGEHLRSGKTRSCGCLQRDIAGKLNRLPEGEAAFNAMARRTKHQARTRGLEWNLTDKQVRRLTKQPCHYCGTKPSQVYSGKNLNGTYIYNGLDRTDNTKGYTIDNVVPCCGTCNHAKSVMTIKEFGLWVERLYARLVMWGEVT